MARVFPKIVNYLNLKGSFKAKINGIYFNTYEMISRIDRLGIKPKTFIDIGANRGMLSKTVNYFYPNCNIYSFEPIKDCFNDLKKIKIKNIKSFNCALSNKRGISTFYESKYDYSSSLLEMTKKHKNSFPYTADSKSYEVDVYVLDDYYNQFNLNTPTILKLDVQGSELDVIRGAEKILPKIDYILCEVSFVELYMHQPLFLEVINVFHNKGYRVIDVLSLNRDKNNYELIQMDILFKRI